MKKLTVLLTNYPEASVANRGGASDLNSVADGLLKYRIIGRTYQLELAVRRNHEYL